MSRMINPVDHKSFQNITIVLASIVVASAVGHFTRFDDLLADGTLSQICIIALVAGGLSALAFLVRRVRQGLKKASRQIDEILVTSLHDE